MNLPNKLTVLRIILVPFMIAALLIPFPHHVLVAGLIFGAASITDMLDGKIARKRNLITAFGKFADPLADKILVIASLICFVALGWCDPVLPIVVLFREFAVSSIRLVAVNNGGEVVAANMWGKCKTASQMVGIVFALGVLAFFEFVKSVDVEIIFTLHYVIIALFWLSAVLCAVSGAIYIWNGRKYIANAK